MDRRTVLAVVLSLGIYYAWLSLRGKPEPSPEELEGTPADTTAEATLERPAPVAAPEPAVVVPVQEAAFEVCGVKARVSNDGGFVFDMIEPDAKAPYHVTPIYSWLFGKVTGSAPGPWSPYGPDPGPARLLTERAQALRSGVGAGPTEPLLRMSLESSGPTEVTLRGESGGVRVAQHLAERREGDLCVVDMVTTWENPGGQPWTGQVWSAVLDHSAVGASRYASAPQPTALVDGDLAYGGALGAGCVRQGTQLSDDSGPIELPGPVSWFGFSDRYFGFYVVPEKADLGSLRFERVGAADQALDGAVLSAPATLAPGGSLAWRSEVYAGENHVASLSAVDPTLDRVVDLGWFAVFGKPLLWILHGFQRLTNSWGVAIILLTVLVKLVFFPMTHKAMKSAQKMQEIQPELNRIREQHADNPTEMNRLVLELMTTNKVNPATGCLPMLVQMPVFFALYQVLLSNVEFYQEPFLSPYLLDLSSPDPYCILPVAVTLLMWGQQQLTTPPANMEPAQQAVLKWMPVAFGLFFFAMPSGLGVYMLVNMALSIFQQWIIKRSLGGTKLPAQPVPF